MNEVPFMDKGGRKYGYGEFFPIELSPHAYNETIAQEYYALTKEDADKKSFAWREDTKRGYDITVPPENLPETINEVTDNILKEVIGCEHGAKCNEQCTAAFKLISQELQFYRQMNLPLPRLCPNCRHYERFRKRNPLKLWRRSCTCAGEKSKSGVYANTARHFHGAEQCPNEFETSYAPERSEIVYCEQCYQAEVV